MQIKFRIKWMIFTSILGICFVMPVTGQIHQYHDLRYAEGFDVDHLLDLEVPESPTPLPLVVFIHGGGWRNGDKSNFRSRVLLNYGFAAASINYRLSGTAKWPAQIHDCKAAIRWLRANGSNYNIDPDRIGVWGSSAGGHLVAMLGTTTGVSTVTIDSFTVDLEGDIGDFTDVSSHINAVCDYFGPSDLLAFNNPDGPTIFALLGDSATVNTGLAKSASPATFVDPTDVPFLIYHGDRDLTVPIEQSQILHDLLMDNHVPSTFVTLEGSGHGGAAFSTTEVVDNIAAFFTQHLSHWDDPSDHLIAHWTLDDISGDIIRDVSPNSFNGTNAGATQTTGILNRALDFNGINQSVNIPDQGIKPPEAIAGLETGTISLWFRYREFSAEMLPLFYFGESDAGTPHNSLIIEIGHGNESNRKLYFTIFNAGFCFDSGINIEPDVWTHFAAVVSSTGNTGYLDGVEMTDRHYNLGSDASYADFFASVPVQEMLALGYGRYGKADPFFYYNGAIDDVRIYDRDLSSNEIKTIFEDSQTAILNTIIRSPQTFRIHHNVPNPFNPKTWIHYELDQPVMIRLSIYNAVGQKIRDLVHGEKSTGNHTVTWDGRDNRGQAVSGGIYLARLDNDGESQTIKMLLIR